jgi:hypothetical protein
MLAIGSLIHIPLTASSSAAKKATATITTPPVVTSKVNKPVPPKTKRAPLSSSLVLPASSSATITSSTPALPTTPSVTASSSPAISSTAALSDTSTTSSTPAASLTSSSSPSTDLSSTPTPDSLKFPSRSWDETPVQASVSSAPKASPIITLSRTNDAHEQSYLMTITADTIDDLAKALKPKIFKLQLAQSMVKLAHMKHSKSHARKEALLLEARHAITKKHLEDAIKKQEKALKVAANDQTHLESNLKELLADVQQKRANLGLKPLTPTDKTHPDYTPVKKSPAKKKPAGPTDKIPTTIPAATESKESKAPSLAPAKASSSSSSSSSLAPKSGWFSGLF